MSVFEVNFSGISEGIFKKFLVLLHKKTNTILYETQANFLCAGGEVFNTIKEFLKKTLEKFQKNVKKFLKEFLMQPMDDFHKKNIFRVFCGEIAERGFLRIS